MAKFTKPKIDPKAPGMDATPKVAKKKMSPAMKKKVMRTKLSKAASKMLGK